MSEAEVTKKKSKKKKAAKKKAAKKKLGRPCPFSETIQKQIVTKGEGLAHGKLVPYLEERGVAVSSYYQWRKKFNMVPKGQATE